MYKYIYAYIDIFTMIYICIYMPTWKEATQADPVINEIEIGETWVWTGCCGAWVCMAANPHGDSRKCSQTYFWWQQTLYTNHCHSISYLLRGHSNSHGDSRKCVPASRTNIVLVTADSISIKVTVYPIYCADIPSFESVSLYAVSILLYEVPWHRLYVSTLTNILIYTYHCDSTPYLHEYTATDCINSTYDRQLDDTYTNWGIELTRWAGDTGDTLTTRWVIYMTQAHRLTGTNDQISIRMMGHADVVLKWATCQKLLAVCAGNPWLDV